MQRNVDERTADMANSVAKYTDELRHEAVGCIISTGKSVVECCRESGLNSKIVDKWVAKRRCEFSGEPDPKVMSRPGLVSRDFTSPVPTYKPAATSPTCALHTLT